MGLSFSTRRPTPTHPYPPPPLDYYPPPYPTPTPTPTPTPPPLYYPPHYYTSNAFTVCNHPNPLLTHHPFFPPFTAAPPPSGEQKPTRVVNSDVNVHKDTLRLEADELKPDRFLVSFVFDALVDGSITICYFAKEEADHRVVPLFPETYVPIKVPFRKGLHQEFRQPSGTGIDLRFFQFDDLSIPSSRYDVYPIVISADTCPNTYVMDDRSYFSSHAFPQIQITQVAVTKNYEGQFTAKVIRQLLWSDDICYELRDIYGLGKSSQGAGKECVICMTEPKDIAVLPCRHMCMCSNCAKELRLQSNKCPICREIIEALIEIKVDIMDE